MPDAGRYRVERVIGRGGMGEVMEAYVRGEGGFERRVAIKRLLSNCAGDQMFLRSFADEARIVSELHHANIVGVFDFGLMDGLPFLVFEHVDGLDIDALESRCYEVGARITTEIALHIATEVAHALDYAHSACDRQGRSMRLVHRDVSPENILISWTGDVKLADFGIAFALRRLEATEAGVRKGKRAYMAPEQRRANEVDARADIFSLGCVLHRLLTARSPLERNQVGQLVLGRGDCEIEASLDADVREIILRATQKAREKRFATAAEMAAACGTALVGRLSRDVRTLMREWIEVLRPRADARAEKGRFGFADLLDVELVLERSEGPVPRFSSRARPRHASVVSDAIKAIEAIEALEVRGANEARGAGELRRAHVQAETGDAVEAETADGPGSTRVTEVDPHQATTHVESDQTVPQYHPPTAILPSPALLPAEAASRSRLGPARWLLVLAAVLAVSAWLVRSRSAPSPARAGDLPPHRATIARIEPLRLGPPASEPPSADSAALGPKAREPTVAKPNATHSTASHPTASHPTANDASADQEATDPNRSAPSKARKRTLAAMRAALSDALDRRGLEQSDLEAFAGSRIALDRWRTADRLQDPAAAEPALQDILQTIASYPISEKLLRERLSRLSSLLSKRANALPKEELDRLETRYFEARAALTPGLADPELEKLARRIRLLALDADRETRMALPVDEMNR